ncbi:MAG: HAD family hydrolase [bacterium]
MRWHDGNHFEFYLDSRSWGSILAFDMLKAITFDLWTTIIEPIDYRESRIEYIRLILESNGYSIDRDAMRSAYSFSLQRFYDVWQNEHRHMPSAVRLGLMLSELKVELSEEMLNRVVKRCEEVVLRDPPPLIPGAEMVLDSLHDSYKIGLICDSGMSPGRVMRQVLARYDLLPYFCATVFSDELGCTKPHLHMFETALEQLGVEAHEALHIGDLLNTDVAGAKAAGMKTVWFNRDKAQTNETSLTPDYEITRLPQVLAIVDQERGA